MRERFGAPACASRSAGRIRGLRLVAFAVFFLFGLASVPSVAGGECRSPPRNPTMGFPGEGPPSSGGGGSARVQLSLVQLLPAESRPSFATQDGPTAEEVRLALGLVDLRCQPLFKAAAAKKQLADGVQQAWSEWQWALGGTVVGKLVVYTDGSAVLGPGWPRAVRTAGWAAVCLCSDPAAEGNLLLLGVAFAPVLVGVHVPGSFGLLRP